MAWLNKRPVGQLSVPALAPFTHETYEEHVTSAGLLTSMEPTWLAHGSGGAEVADAVVVVVVVVGVVVVVVVDSVVSIVPV